MDSGVVTVRRFLHRRPEMDEHELLSLITAAKVDFGPKCKKFAGAVAVELLKELLQRNGIVTSARDVYIEKVPVEIDLLIPKMGAVARHGILYRPEDILVAFEVKIQVPSVRTRSSKPGRFLG